MGPSSELGYDAFLRPSWLVTSRHLFHRRESDGALEEDEDHRHGQECVCEASESGCMFIHLFASVALIRMEDPERAGYLPKGLLLPAPAGSYDSCPRTELRYALVTPFRTVCWPALLTPRVPRSSQQKRQCSGRLTQGGRSSQVVRRPWGFQRRRNDVGGWSPHGRLRISSMQRAVSVSNVIAQGPEGYRLGEHESMIQLDEHLKKKGHDTHRVAKITRRRLVSGVSAKQLEKMQCLYRATWKRKLKEIEASELKEVHVSEALESSQVKKIEGYFHQDPSVQSSIQKGIPRQTEEGREDQEARWHAETTTRADESNATARLPCQRVW